jgi:DNA modification methylase
VNAVKPQCLILTGQVIMALDPKYCDVIVKRWETLTGKKAVLVDNVADNVD